MPDLAAVKLQPSVDSCTPFTMRLQTCLVKCQGAADRVAQHLLPQRLPVLLSPQLAELLTAYLHASATQGLSKRERHCASYLVQT